jgi:hypothetical protein
LFLLILGAVLNCLGILLLVRKEKLANALLPRISESAALFSATAFGFLVAAIGLTLVTLKWEGAQGLEKLGVGTAMLAIGTYLLIQRRELADYLYAFYNRPRREGQLAWLDRRIWEPDKAVCLYISTLFALLTILFGVAVLAGFLD